VPASIGLIRSHMPPGSRKVDMPLSAETPDPQNAAAFFVFANMIAAADISLL
jgi:hypothetical protein